MSERNQREMLKAFGGIFDAIRTNLKMDMILSLVIRNPHDDSKVILISEEKDLIKFASIVNDYCNGKIPHNRIKG